MVDEKNIVYDDSCDFGESRRLKAEVRNKYKGTSRSRSRKAISGKAARRDPTPAPNDLAQAIQGLCEGFGRMELNVQYLTRMQSMMAQSLQGVTPAGHQNNVVVPPREPTPSGFFPLAVQPAADENISMQPTYLGPGNYEAESAYTGTMATDSRMHQSSSDSFMGPSAETPYNPRHDVNTGPYRFPAAPMPGTAYMPHDGILYGYVQGSSTGQSARELKWQDNPYREEREES
jgi:hypothetical protein